jgi:hypothetical protein
MRILLHVLTIFFHWYALVLISNKFRPPFLPTEQLNYLQNSHQERFSCFVKFHVLSNQSSVVLVNVIDKILNCTQQNINQKKLILIVWGYHLIHATKICKKSFDRFILGKRHETYVVERYDHLWLLKCWKIVRPGLQELQT